MNKSETIEKLALALSKMQSEITDVGKDKKGYGYNYADLSSILDVVRPLLSKHELSVSQLCVSEGDKVGVETVLMHSSGQWISSEVQMVLEKGKGMSMAQTAGSIITYARRYALAAIVGIAQTDNDARIEVEKPKLASNDSSIHGELINLINQKSVPKETVQSWLNKANVDDVYSLGTDKAQALVDMLRKKAA